MNCALLIVTLLSAEEEAAAPPPPPPAPEAEVVAPAPETTVSAPADPDEWPGEGRRVHYGIGARVHGGFHESVGARRMLLQSEFTFFTSIRLFGHHELRIGVGIAAGWPDTLAGETNISFRFHLSPRISIGAGAFTYLGFWSMRAGLEVPLAIRLGKNRRHEIMVAVRGMGGGYNNTISFAWYHLEDLRLVLGAELLVGYAAIF